MQFDISPKSTL